MDDEIVALGITERDVARDAARKKQRLLSKFTKAVGTQSNEKATP